MELTDLYHCWNRFRHLLLSPGNMWLPARETRAWIARAIALTSSFSIQCQPQRARCTRYVIYSKILPLGWAIGR